jgi:hypothetical protein
MAVARSVYLIFVLLAVTDEPLENVVYHRHSLELCTKHALNVGNYKMLTLRYVEVIFDKSSWSVPEIAEILPIKRSLCRLSIAFFPVDCFLCPFNGLTYMYQPREQMIVTLIPS